MAEQTEDAMQAIRSRMQDMANGLAPLSDNCPQCGGPIASRNPTGHCDHLYYPESVTWAPKQGAKMSDLEQLELVLRRVRDKRIKQNKETGAHLNLDVMDVLEDISEELAIISTSRRVAAS